MLFEDRTIGDLLEEYYLAIVTAVEDLRERAADLENDELDRLRRLEEELRPSAGERRSLRGLSEAESLSVWETPHYTGDPLTDYWEYRISRDLFDPEELDLIGPPDKELWGEPWKNIKPRVKLLPKGRRPKASDYRTEQAA